MTTIARTINPTDDGRNAGAPRCSVRRTARRANQRPMRRLLRCDHPGL